jgi:type IV pilus assembly protein PilX
MNTRLNHQGFVLITALIFVLILSLLGIAAVRSTLFEERLAGNDTDMAFAKENAELALRDAERDILGLRFDSQYCATAACSHLRPAGSRPTSAGESLTFWISTKSEIRDIATVDGGLSTGAANDDGLFNSDSAQACGKAVWSGANWQDGASPARTCSGSLTSALPTVEYGYFTDAPFPPAQQGVPRPRYVIEMFTADDLQIPVTSSKLYFRVTSVGFGRTSGATGARTTVNLQSVYAPR